MTDDQAAQNEQHRRIQHVLLDILATVDVYGEPDLPPDWLGTFANDLNALGAVSFELDMSTDPPTPRAEITPLLVSVLALVELLIGDVEERASQDRLVVINAIRARIDEVSQD